MPLDLVRDVFEPVFERIKFQCDSGKLRGFLRKCYPSGPPPNGGLEGWFTVQVILALGDLVEGLCFRGPDLVLCDGKKIELKAATNLNTTNDDSSPRGGVIKYCDCPGFAGCLFLGDGSKESKIDELSEGDVEFEKRETIRDGEDTWIVGLLVSSATRGRSSPGV